MEQEIILEGNKLIAELDGWKFHDQDDFYYASKNDMSVRWGSYFEYHSSWDWLMSASEKFCKIPYEELDDKSKYGNPGNTLLLFQSDLKNAIKNFEKERSFEILGEGIKWYNQNK